MFSCEETDFILLLLLLKGWKGPTHHLLLILIGLLAWVYEKKSPYKTQLIIVMLLIVANKAWLKSSGIYAGISIMTDSSISMGASVIETHICPTEKWRWWWQPVDGAVVDSPVKRHSNKEWFPIHAFTTQCSSMSSWFWGTKNMVMISIVGITDIRLSQM